MRVQKLSVELNKFGAAEVTAKIDGKNCEMLVLAHYKPFEGYVREHFALTTPEGIQVAGDPWDIGRFFNDDNEGFSTEGRAIYLYLFESAEKMLATTKPEALIRQD